MPTELTLADALQFAVANYQSGRLQEAEQCCRMVLNADPQQPVANHVLGLIALAVGRHDLATELVGKAVQAMPQEPGFLNSLGEAHRAAKRFDEALACYDRALTLNPLYIEAMSNRAIALHALGRLEEGLASCDAAIKANPQFPAAWSNRGVLLMAVGRFEEALACFDKALEANPGFIDALVNRGGVLRDLGRLEEALAAFDKALAANPNMYAAHDGRGSVLQNLLRPAEALASHREALRLQPDFALAQMHEAICLLLTGEYAEGWKKYESRFLAYPSSDRGFAQPAWLGAQPLKGKTVLLHADQGPSDTILFARYAKAVAAKGAKVVLEAQPALKPLLRGIGAASVIARGDPLPAFDFHCPLASLPLAFGTTLETVPAEVPYLALEKQPVTAWKKKLARGGTHLVGLYWKNDPAHGNGGIRLADLQPLLDVPGLRFVSLQENLSAEELAVVDKRDNFGHAGAGFKETAEMLAALDLVISVDSAWAHWAGAIGKPVWVLLAAYPHWCWLLERQDSPWYPSARLYRQQKPGEWGPVLSRVKRGLAAFGKRA